MLNISNLSSKYKVRKLLDEDIDDIYNLCKENKIFYKYCPPFITKETIKEDMIALPPNKTLEDKYYIGFYDNNSLVAIMDLILSYPNNETAFIGLFMVDILSQHKGIGSSIITEALSYLKECNYKYVRLGYIEGNNQSENFWKKNGFKETGVKTIKEEYTIVVLEKNINK